MAARCQRPSAPRCRGRSSQYNHPSHKFNVTYGLFQPRAELTSTRLRLMRISDYLSNRYGMPPTGNSFSLAPNQRGLEVWGNVEGPGNRGGLEWFAGVVNGRDAGTPPGAGAYGAEVSGLNTRLQAALASEGRTNLEVNSSKDFYLGANYKVGGMGVLVAELRRRKGKPTTSTTR